MQNTLKNYYRDNNPESDPNNEESRAKDKENILPD